MRDTDTNSQGRQSGSVLGIDPGLSVTGYGLVRWNSGEFQLLEAGAIDAGNERMPIERRLSVLYRAISDVIRQYHPVALAVEELYSHYAHPRTAILMGHARGVLCLAAGMYEIPLFDYPATRVKASLTGNGRASKEQIQRMVQRTFGLAERPEPADAADALAIALCHLYSQRG